MTSHAIWAVELIVELDPWSWTPCRGGMRAPVPNLEVPDSTPTHGTSKRSGLGENGERLSDRTIGCTHDDQFSLIDRGRDLDLAFDRDPSGAHGCSTSTGSYHHKIKGFLRLNCLIVLVFTRLIWGKHVLLYGRGHLDELDLVKALIDPVVSDRSVHGQRLVLPWTAATR